MIPRTKTWGQIDPSLADLPDTRPPVQSGKAWLEGQDAAYQRSLMGPAKYDAWKRGEFALDDLVARTHSPDWGTMRRERSLLEIREGRNANTMGTPSRYTAEQLQQIEERLRTATGHQLDDWAAQHRPGGPLADQAAMDRIMAERARRAAPQASASLDPATGWDRWELGRDVHVHWAEDWKRNMGMADDNLPDFNPDNPLEFYGDRLTIYDRSPSTAKHLAELERDIAQRHHQVLRDHYARTDGSGFFIGDRYITDLDDLGHLKGIQPRGWPEGSTFDQVPGVYSPGRKVCACGGDGKGHGSTSLVLHEGGHALDDAYGAASRSRAYRDALDAVPASTRSRWNPYYREDGNPDGYASESWAEAFASWTKARTGTKREQAHAIAKALLGREPTTAEVRAHRSLVDYFLALT